MSEDTQAFIQEQKELYESLQKQITKQKQDFHKKLEHQEKQYNKQHKKQYSELTELKQQHSELKQQHSELKITFEDEIKIREAITIHIDHYVDEIQTKIRVME
ncbi:MAG: DUF342 domain-containing protein, partial [bacterium]|nr:DUF342 domain-containing protein [bacterium]